eukprot:TRINITY_DN11573_c0_g1_i1.p1 TRINITY_DN11573_c0_g1~~TRINITY_DN11573_c0_g1_i1.p1  ORF type:complete len:236 (+),score=-34.54 TRINITY_DN11573_c0_g1_i1:37-744(+)
MEEILESIESIPAEILEPIRTRLYELHSDLLIEPMFDVVIKGGSARPENRTWRKDQYVDLEIHLSSWLFPLVIDESIWTKSCRRKEESIPTCHYILSAKLYVIRDDADVLVERCTKPKENARSRKCTERKVCERLMKCTADSRKFLSDSKSDDRMMIKVRFAFLCINAHHDGLPFRLKFHIAHSTEPSKPVASAEILVSRVYGNRDPGRKVGQGFRIPVLFMVHVMWIVTAQFWE